MRKLVVFFLAFPILILLLATKQNDISRRSIQKIREIDFADKNYLEVWVNSNCITYGIVSDRESWFQSTYIRTLYDLEKSISPEIDGKCMCLYNTQTKEYLTDLEARSKLGLRRDISHLSDLNEILKLYGNYVKKIRTNNGAKPISPLHGSIYSWEEH